MDYAIKATFYTRSEITNDFQEVETTRLNEAFSTGIRTLTVAFKDMMSQKQSVDGQQLYVYTRKNPNTQAVAVGDLVKFPNIDPAIFEIKGIDHKHGNRSELMFLVDLVQDITIGGGG